MTVVLDIITDALQDAGIIAANETPDATDGQKAFRLLQRMLDSDSTEQYMIYNEVVEVFTIPNKEVCAMGPGGDFNTTRPTDILRIYMRDTGGNDLPVQLLSAQQYADIISKPTTSTLALVAWVNPSMPTTSISFWPVPNNTTYTAVIWSLKVLGSFVTMGDNIIFPPGYEEYLETNLAVRCCIAFGRSVPPELEIWATSSKAKLKQQNIKIPILTMPGSLGGGLNNSTFPISPHIFTGY